ncbi:MAG: hypothetical protein JWN41_1285 [Thermoleophilia bacterium]|nr:hypothetical protein [Thermoleophilia bacterium]
MKNVLMKFAGLFIEKVPVDERGKPIPRTPVPPPNTLGGARASAPNTAAQLPPAGSSAPNQPQAQGYAQPAQFHPAAQSGPPAGQGVPTQPHAGGAPLQQPISIALRAWVPQEYAAHLAPFGVHVIAAGGAVTSEQARSWGAHVLVVSAECLGQDLHLLQQPQIPTVFIAPQPVMIPDVPGVVQVQEPLRASDVANAARDAAAAFANARR